MKRIDIQKLPALTLPELQVKLEELATEMATVRLEKMANKLKDVKKTSKLSDDIARIKTVIRQKSRNQV